MTSLGNCIRAMYTSRLKSSRAAGQSIKPYSSPKLFKQPLNRSAVRQVTLFACGCPRRLYVNINLRGRPGSKQSSPHGSSLRSTKMSLSRHAPVMNPNPRSALKDFNTPSSRGLNMSSSAFGSCAVATTSACAAGSAAGSLMEADRPPCSKSPRKAPLASGGAASACACGGDLVAQGHLPFLACCAGASAHRALCGDAIAHGHLPFDGDSGTMAAWLDCCAK
mmetsp:Transcript_12249/g.35179  ORF Transcript_12249/g.35179 Transcript_12249/m.35179 type:complete len:222 (+) Transcript_12249:164-829(+)